jgi:ribose transport system ATP-binding protein
VVTSGEGGTSGGQPRELALECRRIVKTFPGLTALQDVDLRVQRGDVHAIVGENGAGKSTLVKVITGVYTQDSGEILVRERKVDLHGPHDAEKQGIAIIHQDPSLIPQLTVWQNVFLGHERTGAAGLSDRAGMRRRSSELLQALQVDFACDDLVQDLSIAQREQVAICAALEKDPEILILDEPTASLSSNEIQKLFEMIRALRARGVTVVYISHHLGEIFELADRVTVLRDGAVVQTLDVKEVQREEIIRLMIGRDLRQLYPKEDVALGETVLEVKHLTCGERLHDVGFSGRSGEIVGICGLVGCGRSELALSLFGALPEARGEVTVKGRPVRIDSPTSTTQAGIAMIPEDRRNEGLLGELSIRENLSIAHLGLWSRLGVVDRQRERQSSSSLVRALRIAATGLEQEVRTLSGGNQQKVVIGRWISGGPDVFVFNDPTAGVDVGAKVEVYREITEFAKKGALSVFVSSDFEELIGMCDRILVMVKGRIVKELQREEFSREAILYWATSTTAGAEGSPQVAAGGALPAPPRPRRSLRLFLARWGTMVGMLLVLVALGVFSPRFFSPGNLLDVMKQGAFLALISIGLTIALVSGGFDMSVGALSQFTSNLSAGAIIAGLSTGTSLLIGGAVGVVVGLANAAFVLFLNMPPFVATLGSMFVLMGVTLGFNHGQALTLTDSPGFFELGQGHVGPVPVLLLIVIGVMIVAGVFLRWTRLGTHMYAMGGDARAATVRGLSRRASVLLAFCLGGLVVGVSGTIGASYSYGASAVPASLDFLISALAASFLGTTFTRAGQLDVVGTTVAAMFIAGLNNALILHNVSNLALPGIQGLILVISILPGLLRKNAIGQITIF